MKTIANIIDMKNTSHQFWGTEYLCFIDGVGVKIGTTTIATNS